MTPKMFECDAPLSAALFDVDGTLVDRERMLDHAIVDVLTRAGHAIDHSESRRLVGHAWPDRHREMRIKAHLGWDLNTFHDRVLAAYDGLLGAGESPEETPGARDVFERLHRYGLKTALVSGSTHAEVAECVELLGIADNLDCVLGFEDFERTKPAPDGYLAAAARLGVEPSACVVFEDSEVGIASGLAAGCHVVAVTAPNPPEGKPGYQDQSAAHARVAGFDEVDFDFLCAVVSGN